jgi:hypothetical protein
MLKSQRTVYRDGESGMMFGQCKVLLRSSTGSRSLIAAVDSRLGTAPQSSGGGGVPRLGCEEDSV